MSSLTSPFGSISQRQARGEVNAFLRELTSRPQKGDPALHQKLNQLNEALDSDALTEAYTRGFNEHTIRDAFRAEDTYIAERSALQQVKYAVNARQTGFAQKLAVETMSDGKFSETEATAVSQIVSPANGLQGYGPGVGQPTLSVRESHRLRSFWAAPNDNIRSWMVEQDPGKPVDLPAVQALGDLLFEKGRLDKDGWNFVARLSEVFHAPIEDPARYFLFALDGTSPRQGGDKDGPGSRLPFRDEETEAQCQRAALAGREFARQKGLSDSAQARSLFPKR
jgi:hypothetical protein